MGEIQLCGKPIDLLLEKVLCMNILTSDYFRDLLRLKTCNEVIDEIYNQVDHVEPWMTASGFPDIRAIGFLYLRYMADPKILWGWYEQYLKDDEEFSPGSNGRMTTMGVYIRDLLLGQYYFDTLFPRIPVPIMRTITSNLEKMKFPTKHSGTTGESTRGSDETARRPPSVKAALSVSFGQRAPHRASTRDLSPVRRVLPPPHERGNIDDSKRSPSRHRSVSRELSVREYDRAQSRDRDRDREQGWDRERDTERSRDRDCERGRDRERSRDRDRERGRDRDRDRNRDRRHDYDRPYKEMSHEGHRYYRERGGDRRSRSKSIMQQGDGYNSPSQEKKCSASTSSNLAKLKDMYGDLTNQKDDGGKVGRDSGTEEVIRLGGSTWR